MLLRIVALLLGLLTVSARGDTNFEDTRCRCICPSTHSFATNQTSEGENQRRYYTKSNISPSSCKPSAVVRAEVASIVDENRMDAFLANCDCHFESRNTVMIKVVVIFVICVIAVLVAYMGFLMCLDPMIKKQRSAVPYRQQNDEMEDNIFARAASSSEPVETPPTQMRSRNPNVLERVEAEQNRWMRKVEEQRKQVFDDHSILN
ncbi:unnamed protein product, partial [Mesorhabditis spiculigera]